jgi:hypothetical protein
LPKSQNYGILLRCISDDGLVIVVGPATQERTDDRAWARRLRCVDPAVARSRRDRGDPGAGPGDTADVGVVRDGADVGGPEEWRASFLVDGRDTVVVLRGVGDGASVSWW